MLAHVYGACDLISRQPDCLNVTLTLSLHPHLFHPIADTAIPFDLDVVVEVLPDARASISGAICDVAEDRQAAAVVIAGYGKGPIAEFLLGSVTNYVTHHCTRPTVVFHSAATGQHRH